MKTYCFQALEYTAAYYHTSTFALTFKKQNKIKNVVLLMDFAPPPMQFWYLPQHGGINGAAQGGEFDLHR